MKNDRKVAIVTGGSSGIGKQIAIALSEKGYSVYEFSRRDCVSEGITHVTCDVTDEKSVICAVNTVFEKQGRIDVLVNNAGMGISGAVEFTELEDAKHLFDVNFFGMVNATKAVLGHMRKAGHGRIVNISSVAAMTPIPFQTYYSASKSAISTYSQALANEIRPFGISVCAIMPGDIKTGFTGARKKSMVGDDLYSMRISRSVARMEHDEQTGMSPETAGRYIAKIASKKSVKPLYSIGISYKAACVVATLLPSRLRNFVLRILYAN